MVVTFVCISNITHFLPINVGCILLPVSTIFSTRTQF